MKNSLRIGFSVLLVVFLVIVWFIGINVTRTSIKQHNFPLSNKWSTHLDDKVAALSIIGDKIALVRTKNALYALDIQSGKVVWDQDLSWQADARPAIANKEMVYTVGGNVVKALSQVDGSLIWQQSVYGFASIVLDVSESVLVVEDGKGVNIYDASTGALLRDNPACRTVVQAYISGDSVFVPCDGILRINVSTGQTSWWEENKGIIGNVGYGDGVMYLSQGKPIVVAFDLNNWKELWRIPIVIDGFESFDVYNDLVFFTDFSKICAFKRLDGSKQWCADAVPYPQNPSVIGETVYVFNGNHKEITAFELMTGKLIGKLEMSNFNYFSTYQQLMVSSDNILLFANGRDVFAFE